LPDSLAAVKIEIAGPGFINFFMSQGANALAVSRIIEQGADYGLSKVGEGQRVLLEFVSANPTGPLQLPNQIFSYNHHPIATCN
jgi:arginyl-tRNA synthetase